MTNVAWRFSGLAVKALLQFATVTVLSRLLPVEAFGLIAYAMIFVNLADLIVQLGIGPAVIQAPEVDDELIRTAFTLSVLAGAAGSFILWLAAPLLAHGLEETRVLRYLSAVYFFSSFGSIAGALLQRQIRFREFAAVEVGSYAVGYSLCTLAFALNGFGVYSLVWGALLQALLRSALFIAVVRHSLVPALATARLKRLLQFGGGLTAARVFNYAAFNLDYFLAKQFLGNQALGLYSRAFYMMRLPTDLVATSLHSVLFPAFSRLQNHDQRLRSGFLKSTAMTSLLTAPGMATLAILAPQLVVLLFGQNWAGTIRPLQILCPVGFFNLYTLGDALLKAVGRIRTQMAGHLLFAVSVAVGVMVGKNYGISGIAVGVLVANLLMFLYMIRASLGCTQATWGQFWQAQAPALLLTALVAIAAILAGEMAAHAGWNEIATLSAKAAAALSAFGLGLRLPLDTFRELRSLIKERFARKSTVGAIIEKSEDLKP